MFRKISEGVRAGRLGAGLTGEGRCDWPAKVSVCSVTDKNRTAGIEERGICRYLEVIVTVLSLQLSPG